MRVAIIFIIHRKKVRAGFEAKDKFSADSSEGLIVVLDFGGISWKGLP